MSVPNTLSILGSAVETVDHLGGHLRLSPIRTYYHRLRLVRTYHHRLGLMRIHYHRLRFVRQCISPNVDQSHHVKSDDECQPRGCQESQFLANMTTSQTTRRKGS